MEKLLYIGNDSKGSACYMGIPFVLEPYEFELLRGIFNGLRSNDLKDNSNSLIVDNMSARGILHMFIEKHMRSFFLEIDNDADTLESKIKSECMYLFSVTKWDDSMDKMYKNYKKGTSIESMVSRHIATKLEEYIDRLNKVEL